jgi:hypothetical protein
MQPIAVQLLTMQSLLPETTIRPGQSLVARVAERGDHKGILMVAGKPLVAELPENVRAGDVLKLAVTDVSAEKVVMQMQESQNVAQHPGTQAPIPLAVPFPDGQNAYVEVDDDGSGVAREDGDVAAIALTYQSPALGPINLRIGMDAGSVIAEIRIAAGGPHQLAEITAGALREALQEKTDRIATVNVAARPGSFNVSA